MEVEIVCRQVVVVAVSLMVGMVVVVSLMVGVEKLVGVENRPMVEAVSFYYLLVVAVMMMILRRQVEKLQLLFEASQWTFYQR